MQHTKYNAFGYVLMKAEASQGEIITDQTHEHFDNIISINRPYNPNLIRDNFVIGVSSNIIWLVVKGTISFTNLYNGDTFEWAQGYSSIDTPMPVGKWSFTHDEDTEVFSFSPGNNVDNVPIMPNVSTFKLLANTSTTTTGEERIFLCSGEVSIGGVSVVGPKQLVISTGKTITATTDSYGFKFN